MSVSVALLPVALAMRIVMGKDKFENWVRAQQVRVPTSFETKTDIARAMKKAGYDAINFGGSLKTHLDGEKTFFFWEFENGQWQAVFSKYHDRLMLNAFMQKVEKVAGRKIFAGPGNAEATEVKQFPTNFRDRSMLIEALQEFGANPKLRTDGTVVCKIDRSKLVFSQSEDAPFVVEIDDGPNLEQVYQYMSDIDEDYKRCVQTAVYEKVKARAAEKNLVIDGEEVLPDKTIVMTLRVQ